MAYVGIDFHKYSSYVTKMDEKGNILEERNIKNTQESLTAFVESLGNEDKVVLEATGNWYHFYELVEEKAMNVVLSHPAKTKAIAAARIKNDRIDSKMLAHLLRTDLIPEAYIPKRDVRDTRELLRYRSALVSVRTSLKNRVRAILSKNGLSCPHSNIFGKKSLLWIKSLPLRKCYLAALEGYANLAQSLSLEIAKIEEDIKTMAEESPEATLLMSMPGISYYSALLIVSEIGDVNRFPSSSHLASYSGLVPSVYSSGSVTRMGRITKTGSRYLRWILIENSLHAVKGSYRFSSLYRRVAARSGKNAAKVAVARKMAICIYSMLKRKELFRDTRPREKMAGHLLGVIA